LQYFTEAHRGENRKVLFESVKKTGDGGMEILEGYSDNYIRVTTPYRAEWSNQIVDWTI
jgi:threonylcarbamoyladenosine tRNA methylthiotransferase MtaB